MSCGLAIFVASPSHTPVKTRLWPALGRRAAEALHLTSAEAVASIAEVAQRDSGAVPYWAVAEERGVGDDMWTDLPVLRQGPGDPGLRLAGVYAELLEKHGAALLLEADTPQLEAADLGAAISWLISSERRLVLGRAFDGGFWLIGGNMPIPASAWSSVQYSRHDTAARLIDAMQRYGRWRELRVLRGLDTAQDIAPVCTALGRLHRPTAAQTRLRDWLEPALRSPGAAASSAPAEAPGARRLLP
jgi:glycosyltransferase A (GT-A) superfamily protein (DUF2064 family)